jgi:hypothetical protein
MAAALCVGTALWLACTWGWTEPDSQPWRSWTFSVGIVGSAAAAGWVTRTDHQLIAASLVGPGVLLAGWTVPRGDDDGLWMVIYFLLAGLAVAAAGGVLATRAVRSTFREKRSL